MNMNDKVIRKLKSNGGETITETLVSLLIASLALVMLAGTLTTSSGLIMKGRAKLEEYYSANEEDSGVVKMKSGEGVVSKADGITITASDNAIEKQSYKVTYYKNDKFDSKPVVAYKAVSSTSSD